MIEAYVFSVLFSKILLDDATKRHDVRKGQRGLNTWQDHRTQVGNVRRLYSAKL